MVKEGDAEQVWTKKKTERTLEKKAKDSPENTYKHTHNEQNWQDHDRGLNTSVKHIVI